MQHIMWLAAIGFLAAALSAQSAMDVEKRIDTLLSRMTLEEKIGQMSQSTAMATPISDQIKAEIRAGRWGSFLNAGSPADRAEAQRIATKDTRLGIPLLFGRDVIHGYKTIFPIPLGQAASWNPELIEEAARQAAREASAEGIRWTFAPMVDIARDPRWGRIAESLGEDPYLAGVLAAAMVSGFQGTNLSDSAAVAASVKHFAGYGAAEAGRDYNSAWIPEILLREVYLPPFVKARDAGAASFMTAFNTLNGVPATGNRFLLTDILRGEWKYDGVVVSDYEAVTEMIPHGYARDRRDAAAKAVAAGVDMEMVSTAYYDELKHLVESGTVSTGAIDGAVRNILRLKYQAGPVRANHTGGEGSESDGGFAGACGTRGDRECGTAEERRESAAVRRGGADAGHYRSAGGQRGGPGGNVEHGRANRRCENAAGRVSQTAGRRPRAVRSRTAEQPGPGTRWICGGGGCGAARGCGGAVPGRGADSFRRGALASVPRSAGRAGGAGRCGLRDGQADGGGDHGRPSADVSRCGGKGGRGAVRLASGHDGWAGDREAAARTGGAFGQAADHVSANGGAGSDLLFRT